jgi:hypothetical protein
MCVCVQALSVMPMIEQPNNTAMYLSISNGEGECVCCVCESREQLFSATTFNTELIVIM